MTNETDPGLLAELEGYPRRYLRIAAAMENKSTRLEMAVESGILEKLSEKEKDQLLISHIRQNCRLVAELAKLKRELLVLRRERGTQDRGR